MVNFAIYSYICCTLTNFLIDYIQNYFPNLLQPCFLVSNYYARYSKLLFKARQCVILPAKQDLCLNYYHGPNLKSFPCISKNLSIFVLFISHIGQCQCRTNTTWHFHVVCVSFKLKSSPFLPSLCSHIRVYFKIEEFGHLVHVIQNRLIIVLYLILVLQKVSWTKAVNRVPGILEGTRSATRVSTCSGYKHSIKRFPRLPYQKAL